MDILGVSRNHAAFHGMMQATESAHCCTHSVSSQSIADELLSWYKVGIVSRLEAEVLEALRRQGLVELPGHFVWLIRTVLHLTPLYSYSAVLVKGGNCQ